MSGNGKYFTTGLDIKDHPLLFNPPTSFNDPSKDDISRQILKQGSFIKSYQDTFTAIEECTKPGMNNFSTQLTVKHNI